MTKQILAILFLAAIAANAGDFQMRLTNDDLIAWDGSPLILAEKVILGEKTIELTKSARVTEKDGWQTLNNWQESEPLKCRRELAVSPGGKEVEISFQGQVDSYTVDGVSAGYGFYVDLKSLDGMKFKALGGRTARPTSKEGTISLNMKNGNIADGPIRWISFEKDGRAVSFDFNPQGVTTYTDFGPNGIQGLWNASKAGDRLYFSVGYTYRFFGGTITGKAIILNGGFEQFDKRHVLEKYGYYDKMPITALFTADSPELAACGKKITAADSGSLYRAVRGNGKTDIRAEIAKPGLYLVTLRLTAYDKPTGKVAINCNGEKKTTVESVPAQSVTTVIFSQWLDGKELNIELDGDYQVSSLSLQQMLTPFEDFQFRRSFWRIADCFEPSFMYGSRNFTPPVYAVWTDNMPLTPHSLKMPEDYELKMDHDVLLPPNDEKMAWRYNSSIGSLGPGNNANFEEFNTPEKVEKRIQELKSEKVNTIIVNGYLSRHLFKEELPRVTERLKAITEAAHRQGMKVIDHQDLTLLWNMGNGFRVLTANPGLLMRYIDSGCPTWGFCLNNPTFRKGFFNDAIALIKETGIDGMMVDEVSFFDPKFCGCPHCRARFHKDTGLTLPTNDADPALFNPKDPFWKVWLAWRIKTVGDWWVDFRREINKVRSDFTLMNYTTHYGWRSTYASLTQGVSLNEKGRAADFQGTEIMSRNVMVSRRPVMSYRMMKSAIGYEHGKPIFGLIYPNNDWNIAYFGWALNNMNNQVTWNISAPPEPTSGLPVYTAFDGIPDRKTSVPATDTAILYSLSSKDWPVNMSYNPEPLGTSELLNDLNIPHKFLLEESLASGKLKDVRNLLILNASSLSDEQIKIIRDFAANGGTVYLSAHAGTCDLLGNYRKKWPFADIFGFSLRLPVKMTKTKSITYDGKTIPFTASYPVIAGEPGSVKIAVEAKFGKGRFIYSSIPFGSQLAEDEQTVGNPYKFKPDPKLYDLYAALLADHFKQGQVFEAVRIPQGVLTSVWRSPEGLAVHLLNASGVKIKPRAKIPSAMKESSWGVLTEPLVMNVRMPKLSKAYLSSPDFEGGKEVKYQKLDQNRWQITIPPELLKRYSILKLIP